MFPLLAFTVALFASPDLPQELPQTQRLEWPEEDLSDRLMTGAHRFAERKIAEAPAKRASLWARDYSSPEAYAKSVAPNRALLRTILGVVDEPASGGPAAMERYGDDKNPALVAQTEHLRIYQVRWPVLDGFWGCGLLAEPKDTPVAAAVVVPDAAQTPEQLFGLAPGASQAARRLAENGFEVIVPVTLSREKLVTNDEQIRASDQTYREWIYRQAFHMGRHSIGYEIQSVLAAVGWLTARGKKVGVCGFAEGGQTAFYSAALDERISVALVSGYFDSRQRVWTEPIYRNIWGLLREFGDAEIANLILPRNLVIEHSTVPDITGHKGEWHTPELANVSAEVDRIGTGSLFSKPPLVRKDGAPFSEEALARFAAALGVKTLAKLSPNAPVEKRATFDAAARHLRFFHEIEGHIQRLVQRSEHVRDRAFLFSIMPELEMHKWTTEPRLPMHSEEKFIQGAKRFRARFRDEAMGRFDEPLLPFHARTRVVKATEKWTAYDVVLDVYPELFAWGLLVLPKDLKPGERRPVVVCQHGRNGLPRNLLDAHNTGYRDVAAKLAERGFITFAPHNLYRGEDRYRWLARKANTVKATLFSFIIASHDQILRWLETQPFVDGNRIAFYGLSYGGETAVRVPPLLEKYALSICSGDFNQWTRKVAATEEPFSFMRTIEWEMPYWNLGNTFDYAEMAYLIFPRPFMVERGHLDLVGRDQWVAHEYAKVRWLYTQLGRADRTEIEFFQGGHSMRAVGSFAFLHKHLRWPEPANDSDPRLR
jgi:dienelactone hydrolase